MPCEEWSRLVEQYRSAIKGYSEAASGLSGLPGAEFDKAWEQAEKARKISEGYRTALLDHEHEHGCLVAGRSSNRATHRQRSRP